MPNDVALLELLDPILARVAALELPAATDPARVQAIEAALEQAFPYAGERVQAIGRVIAGGISEGWLANRGEPDARFSRVAKADDATHGLSIDIVSMLGAGLEHTHPGGEVTIGFPAHPGGNGRFEGREPGWVVLGPGSRHVPRVEQDRMNLIYFLPAGAVEWHRD